MKKIYFISLISFFLFVSNTYAQFKYEDYGLRIVSNGQKSILVASEHEDDYVAYLIGSTLKNYSQLGIYVDITPIAQDYYTHFDYWNSKKQYEKTNQILTQYPELNTYTVQTIALAGYEMFKKLPVNELQERYSSSLGPEGYKVFYQRGQLALNSYNQLLQQAKKYNQPKKESFFGKVLKGIAKGYLQHRYQQNTWGYVSGPSNSNGGGIPVYTPDECVGAVVAGKCHGSVIPKNAYRKKCYGQMVHGQCTGPMF